MVKPSFFRKFLLRFVLSLVRDGADKAFILSKLGEMTNIHFARWLLIDGMLVFLSNYDGSWSSYLGDFSHQGFGINAIWSNTISFPHTLLLFGEGSYDLAAEEYRVVRHFHPAPLFYSAYRNYPVTNILQYVNFRDRLASAIAQAERLELSMGTFRKVSRDQIQGLVASGYNNLDHVCFLFLKIEKVSEAKKWLDGVVAERLTTAVRPSGGKSSTALNIGFTWKGLAQLVRADKLRGFPPEFVLGMNRQGAGLVLGDTGISAESSWEFGGNNAEKEIHVLLMLYGGTSPGLAEFAKQVCGTAEFTQGFSVVTRQKSHRTKGDETEPFGYRDGISQPQVVGFGRGQSTEEEDCKTGEFVLGYENVFGKIAQGPSIVHDGNRGRLLPDTPDQPGQKALGFNGTYLVFRKLEQDVEGFTNWLDNQSDQTGRKMDPELLAAKIMGRWRSGAPLMQARDRDDPKLGQSNDFNFSNDPKGLVCPIGAHIRRANPRDSLQFSPDTSIQLSNHHRIIRRGRKYSEPGSRGIGSSPNPNSEGSGSYSDPNYDDSGSSVKPKVGLYFIAINADLRRQFEFIQQTWLNNPTFNGLERNRDPIVGDHSSGGVFTIPSTPVHQELGGLQRFVTVRGGGYFFLPSKNALSYLANYP